MDDRFDASGAPELATFRHLMGTSLRMKRSVGALIHQSGMTPAQFFTLIRIPDQGIPITKLAAKAWADPGNASGVVDRLEREGLVERRPSPGDRRVVQVHATADGRQRIAEIWPAYRSRIRHLMAPLNADELSELRALLNKLTDREEQHIV